jgi:peptidoglycan/xylan/chitin deacetylase (PgdA/CDA1 family)
MRLAWLAALAVLGLASHQAQAGQVAAGQPPIPVLTYHRFDPVAAKASTIVTDPVFTAQMQYLATHHIAVVKLRDALAALHGGPAVGNAVVLTADDGWRSVYTDMFPVIRRLNLPVTLFINPPMIGAGAAFLTWPMIEEMVKSGLVDVQPHTMSHPNFNTERARRDPAGYAAFIEHEIAGARAPITQHLNLPADLLAWPFGIHDAQLEAAAQKAGFAAAYALGSSAVTSGSPDFALPRYQIYDTDRDARFAWLAAGNPRQQAHKKVTA